MRIQKNYIHIATIALWWWSLFSVWIPAQAAVDDSNDKDDDDDDDDSNDDERLTTRLVNGVWFPLVGYGLGNLPHEAIADQVTYAWDVGYRLFDTAHSSRKARFIRQGLQRIQEREEECLETEGKGMKEKKKQDVVHVVTKIWYTHLGYNRTRLALQEIIKDYDYFPIPVQLHVLIHLPRCRNDLEWMTCQEEEDQLPPYVKTVGPPPHQNPQAYLGTWIALEEAYLNPSNKIASIGVSNFGLNDLEALQESATIMPHIMQDNVWNLVFHPHIVEFCREHKIAYQVYNVMSGIVEQRHLAPEAWEAIGGSAAHLLYRLTVEEGVAVIPHTVRHLTENSPSAVLAAGKDLNSSLSLSFSSRTHIALQALLQGTDLPRPRATFVNRRNVPVYLYWLNHNTHKEIPIHPNLFPGESFTTNTFFGHTFVVYDAVRKRRREYQVKANFGEEQNISIYK